MKIVILLITIVSLSFGQNQKKQTLIERQSSASCSACANAHKQFQPYIEQFEDDVVIVTYQRHDNAHYDPMGIFAIELVDARMKGFYSNSSFPTAFVNGGDRQFLLSLTDFEPEEATSMVNIEIDGNLFQGPSMIEGANKANINIEFDNWSKAGIIEGTNTRAFAILKEKTLVYDTPPGSNGEKVFYDVMRYMFGNPNGIMLDWVDGRATLNLEQEIDDEVSLENLYAVVFLQNVETREVFQAQEFKLPIKVLSTEEEGINEISIYPNPAGNMLQVKNVATNSSFEIIDNNGVRILQGKYQDGINIQLLNAGAYFLKIEGITKKFIKE